MEWWAITNAVPGSYGPAQVPITPLTAIAPLTCGEVNQSSSRSAMLMVSSRVTSAVVRTSIPRWLQASLARSTRSAGLRDPTAGGTRVSNGPSTSASPASQAFHRGQASASCRDQRAISSYVRAGSSS